MAIVIYETSLYYQKLIKEEKETVLLIQLYVLQV